MMKAGLYARVSTTDKEQNPENQLMRLREYAQRQGWEYEEFTDFLSGKDANRPGFSALLSRCKRREFDIIAVVRLDRMMRSVQNTLNVMDDLNAWGVRFLCLDQPIDTGTASGRFQLQMLAAVAEFEREQIRERVKDGLARARGQGKILGRKKKRSGVVSRATYYRLKKEGVVDLNTLTIKIKHP